jgi:hypothetical protein
MSSILNFRPRQLMRDVTHNSGVLKLAMKGRHDGNASGSGLLIVVIGGEQRKGTRNGKGFSW